MKCPVCKEINLVMADRQGIEIDYCPECRGIWLDRGELDKLIERSGSAPSRQRPNEADYGHGHHERHEHHEHHEHHSKDHDYYKKRKKNFLGELFDF